MVLLCNIGKITLSVYLQSVFIDILRAISATSPRYNILINEKFEISIK